MQLKFKKLHSSAVFPTYATEGSAGMDLYATERNEFPTIHIGKHAISIIDCGFALELPYGFYGKIESRSSLASRGIVVVGGILDSDYRGEVKVMLLNATSKLVALDAQKAIAQLVILPIIRASLQVVTELNPTRRGDGAFGSTDAKPLADIYSDNLAPFIMRSGT